MLNDEQRAERMQLIGASEAAGVAGLSRYHSAHATWRRLVHGEVVELEGEDLDRGNFLEHGCSRWYAKKTAQAVGKPEKHFLHPEFPFIGALPDGIVCPELPRFAIEKLSTPTTLARIGAVCGLEVKNPGPWAEDWGKPGTDQVPVDAFVQAVVGMACTGLPRWDICAPLDGALCIFPIERNLKIEAEIIQRLCDFWTLYVETKLAPSLTYAAVDGEWVKQRWKFSREEYLEADALTPGSILTLEQLERAVAEVKKWEDTKETCTNRLKEVIGYKGGIRWQPGKRVDWLINKAKSTTDWRAIAMELIPLAAEVKGATFDFDAMVAAHTTHEPGNRPFVPRFGKGQV